MLSSFCQGYTYEPWEQLTLDIFRMSSNWSPQQKRMITPLVVPCSLLGNTLGWVSTRGWNEYVRGSEYTRHVLQRSHGTRKQFNFEQQEIWEKQISLQTVPIQRIGKGRMGLSFQGRTVLHHYLEESFWNNQTGLRSPLLRHNNHCIGLNVRSFKILKSMMHDAIRLHIQYNSSIDFGLGAPQ